MPSTPQRRCGADHPSFRLHSASLAAKPAVRPSRHWQQWLAAAALACLPLGAQAADDVLAADKPLSASAIQAIESEVGARIGVTVLDTADGTRFSWRGDERFPMSSTFKVLACGHLLSRVDEGQESLSRKVEIRPVDLVTYSPITEHHTRDGGLTLEALCHATITTSDNTAGNLILDALGGPAALTAYLRRLNDDSTRLDRRETALNEATPGDPRDTTTPHAMAATLQRLLVGDALSEPSRLALQGWMLANTTGDDKLRAALPDDWQIADKTGGGGYGTNNDVAILWPPLRAPLIVAVYLTESEADLAARNAAIADVGRLLVKEVLEGESSR
ncbi:class A beta-lactamase [Cobetia amphilecti]|uniref:class A beta-lactamase n=1 Tax=Cobetia amphilecti TaxID=1055104 RepID=UPI00244CDD4B|nr:class A beta-lactamase [Cobetia litoralis]MDH2420125.1 class A beta-lactamase [Cobetia litoralis]MDH2422478.1 class A beta-lactamase [Cobetia litoralis]